METSEVLVLDENVGVPSKKEIEKAAGKLVEKVSEGYMNPLLAYGQITALEKMLKIAKDSIAESALEEAERYEAGGRQGFGAYGATFQVKESGVKYDYSANEYWQQLKEQVDLANAELKGHETTLFQLGKYAKSSKTIVQVTIK